MSKRNYVVDRKELRRLEKKVARINWLKDKIKQYERELAEINENESWLNYLGSGATDTLFESEKYRLQELKHVINYCSK